MILAMGYGALAGQADWVTASLFALTGMIVSPFVLHYAAGMDQSLRLILFAVLMLAAAWRMQAGAVSASYNRATDINVKYVGKAAASGVAAGALAGLFGIGGGFIIVPLLVMGLKPPYRRAVRTSLAVIFLISLSGIFYGALGKTEVDWNVFMPFAAGGMIGMLAGTQLTGFLPERMTCLVFSGIVPLLAMWILFDNLWLGNGGAS